MSDGNHEPLPLMEVIDYAIRCAEGAQNVHKRYFLALDDLLRIKAALAQQAGAVGEPKAFFCPMDHGPGMLMHNDDMTAKFIAYFAPKGQKFLPLYLGKEIASSAPGGGGECEHAWIDATNEHVSNTAYCSKCGKLSDLASAGIVRPLSPKEQV